jgi:multidrug efflux system membrane fusion protein
MKRRGQSFWTIAAIAATALFGCSSEPPQTEEIVRPVMYEPVYATGGGQARSFSGAARADVESNLSFKVAGNISRVHVKVGDRVEKGAPIADLDPTDFELQVEDAEASLLQSQSQARNARANYNREQSLYVNQNASRADLDAALAQKESAEATVASTEKKLELAKRQLRYTRLTAPAAGSIASVDAEVNENVSSGRSIVMLAGTGSPEVEVAVPEILIDQIQEGAVVTVRFDAIPGGSFPATVTEVGIASVGFATTYQVKVRLEAEEERIRPGMAAEVTFRFSRTDDRERFVVPPVAVAEDGNGRHVFLVTPTEDGFGVVKRIPVVVGQLTSRGLEITDGLNDGDLLITAGVSRITDGQKVRLPALTEGQ